MPIFINADSRREIIMKNLLYLMIMIFLWIQIDGLNGISMQIENDLLFLEDTFYFALELFTVNHRAVSL